jgi:hypothetical protein
MESAWWPESCTVLAPQRPSFSLTLFLKYRKLTYRELTNSHEIGTWKVNQPQSLDPSPSHRPHSSLQLLVLVAEPASFRLMTFIYLFIYYLFIEKDDFVWGIYQFFKY